MAAAKGGSCLEMRQPPRQIVATAATCLSIRQRRTYLAQAKRQRDRPRNTAAISWICVFATGIADWKRGQASPHMAKAEGGIPPNAFWLG